MALDSEKPPRGHREDILKGGLAYESEHNGVAGVSDYKQLQIKLFSRQIGVKFSSLHENSLRYNPCAVSFGRMLNNPNRAEGGGANAHAHRRLGLLP